ncbi:hypothetical protein BGX24_010175 [Mortierella sp. AD032]|nr:hypothetical protein BGX24_010175 [Mortierella sp. AD032]
MLTRVSRSVTQQRYAVKEVQHLMVQFVSKHAQLFKGTLKTVSMVNSGIWFGTLQSFPEELQQQLCQMLPPLHKPWIVGDENYN